MCRAWLGLKAQAWALKHCEPSLGSRLRLGLAWPGLEEGTQEMCNGHDENVLNGQLTDKLLTYNSGSNITLVCVNVVA